MKSRLLVCLLSALTAAAAQAITTLPETSTTAPASGLREEQPTGAYGNPEWTQHRRFSTTRVFIQKNPWEVGIEQWGRWRNYSDGTDKFLFTEEIEIGLPGRIQLDLYYDWVVEGGKADHKDVAFELRYALADWGVLWGNPTLYGEYKLVDPQHGGDVYEFKLLLGDDFGSGWHWGVNFIYEQELSGEKAREMAVTLGIGYTVIDEKLSVGLEAKYANETVLGSRGDAEQKVLVGPSLQFRPTTNTHIDLVGLAGVTKDAPDFEGWLIFGIDFGRTEDKSTPSPVSGRRD